MYTQARINARAPSIRWGVNALKTKMNGKTQKMEKKSILHLENGGTGQAGVCSFAGPFFHTAEKIRCISVLLRFMSE